MDLHMPLLDGLDTARMIREREAAGGAAERADRGRDSVGGDHGARSGTGVEHGWIPRQAGEPGVPHEDDPKRVGRGEGGSTSTHPLRSPFHRLQSQDGGAHQHRGARAGTGGARCLRHTFQRAPNTARRRSRARRCIGGSGGFSQPEGKLPGASVPMRRVDTRQESNTGQEGRSHGFPRSPDDAGVEPARCASRYRRTHGGLSGALARDRRLSHALVNEL